MNKLNMHDRFWAKVEKTDTCWNWTAAKTRGGYGHISRDDRMVKAHRLSWEMVNGPIPNGMVVDHTCHNTGCVNPAHLRLATIKENDEHRRGANRNSATGVRGVSYLPNKDRYVARVRHNGEPHYAGCHRTIEEAEAAAIAKRLELFTRNDTDRVAA